MKKRIAFCLAALLLFLAACGKGETVPETSAAAEKETTAAPTTAAPATTAAPETTTEEETESVYDPASDAEVIEVEYRGIILSLLGHFEEGAHVEGDFAYDDPYFGSLHATCEENTAPHVPDGDGETLYATVPNEDLGEIDLYMNDEYCFTYFAVGMDAYELWFTVKKSEGLTVDNAVDWFLNLVVSIRLNDEGREKAGAATTDSLELQAFFMPTFEALTGTTPGSFTASDPQPGTIYLIVAGEGYTIDNKLYDFDDKTEEEYSEHFSGLLSDLEWYLGENYEDLTMMFTSDPNRASVIIVTERYYYESSREYEGVTAYDCEYIQTVYNTSTQQSSSFSSYTKPETMIKVAFGANKYYCSTTYVPNDYYNFLEPIIGWFDRSPAETSESGE